MSRLILDKISSRFPISKMAKNSSIAGEAVAPHFNILPKTIDIPIVIHETPATPRGLCELQSAETPSFYHLSVSQFLEFSFPILARSSHSA